MRCWPRHRRKHRMRKLKKVAFSHFFEFEKRISRRFLPLFRLDPCEAHRPRLHWYLLHLPAAGRQLIVFSRFPCVSHRRTPCADISARIRCDICSSILYALNCLCHSLLSGLPLFCSLQLPDRISTITEGVLFFPIGRSLF